jgi:hypothetical protein
MGRIAAPLKEIGMTSKRGYTLALLTGGALLLLFSSWLLYLTVPPRDANSRPAARKGFHIGRAQQRTQTSLHAGPLPTLCDRHARFRQLLA